MTPRIIGPSRYPSRLVATFAGPGALLCGAGPGFAADVLDGWGSWWLPPDRSVHGAGIDSLFLWIFWITMVAFVAVQITLIVFLIKYRHRPERRKAVFTHGNTRLEMIWTLVPALILAGLALGSKKVWDEYRYSPAADDPGRATILVIGQQFKWNVIYPGPDGKLGRYLVFPRPSDPAWPPNADGTPFGFQGVPGPASLPYGEAVTAINTYIDQVNPLGKVFNDPDGLDDDWAKTPGREIVVPANRPVEVQLSSKDVIHSFFLPNFRVKLDAVPGMRGRVYFTATMTSKQREEASRRQYPIDELIKLVDDPATEWVVSISEADKERGAEYDRRARQWLFKEKEGRKPTIVRDGGTLTPERAAKLKENGVTTITAYQPGYWDVVCAELCGQGHNTMQAQLVVVDNDEFKRRFETPRDAGTAMAD